MLGANVVVKLGVEKLAELTVTLLPPRFEIAITPLEKLLPKFTLYADQLDLFKETLLELRSAISTLSIARAFEL